MSQTVSDFFLDRLTDWGVKRIYGYPGDGINGLMGALGRAEERFEFVQARHEESAAFMACAHAKYSGEVGVCLATSGPGAIHLLNGLYDAKLDHQPVVAIMGQQKQTAIGAHYQQEVDLQNLFKDVAGKYVQTVTHPGQLRHVVDRAFRIAKSERTVTAIVIPNDVQEADAMPSPPRAHGSVYSSVGYSEPRVVPTEADLQHAAQVLNEGKRVAILVGAGALNAAPEVMQVAELTGAGVAKALLGKGVLPDDLPYVTGSIGLLGTHPSWELMSECDTLLMIGSSFPYSEFLPEEGQARGVQIDLDAGMLGIRYPMEVHLHGDSAETLRALIPHLEHKQDRAWRDYIEASVAHWWKVLEGRAMNEAKPINPQRVFWELSKQLPDNCILAADSGSAANWYARDLKIRPGMLCSLSGGLATMGCGVPYVIAAKFTHPDRPVIGLVGDGAMQMIGNNELITIAKYWKQWANPNLVILVLNNRDLNQVTWEQRVLAGDPKLETTQNLPDFPYATYAEILGLGAIKIDRPEQVADAWRSALSADRPFLIEAYTDPDVPPMPPHIRMEQAKSYLSAIFKGDADARGIIKQSAKEFLDSYVPGSR